MSLLPYFQSFLQNERSDDYTFYDNFIIFYTGLPIHIKASLSRDKLKASHLIV